MACARALAPRSNPIDGMTSDGDEDAGARRRIRRSRARGWTSARRWCRPSVIDCFGSIFDEEEEGRARVGAIRWMSARRWMSAARGGAGGARAIAQTKTRDRLCVSGGPGHDIIGFERGGEGDAIVPAYALRGHEGRGSGWISSIDALTARLETVR